MVGFTDGAVEIVDGDWVVTVGGVLFDPLSNKPASFFAERVQEKKVQERTPGTRYFRLRSSR